MRRHQNYVSAGVCRENTFQHFQPSNPRHHEIEEHNLGPRLFEYSQAGLRIIGGENLYAAMRQNVFDEFQALCIVVNGQ
jgi:hypothetical protein